MTTRAGAVRVHTGYAWPEVAAFAALGCSLLLLRMALPQAPGRAWDLAGIYAMLAAASLWTWSEPEGAGVIEGRSVRPATALIVGLAAVLASGRAAGPALPVAGSVPLVTLGLNSAAAVAEEAFFRKALYAKLIRYGAPSAVGLTAVLFGLIHVPAYGLAALWVDLGAGLLLSWQRWATGTWLVPAATHVAANLLAVMR